MSAGNGVVSSEKRAIGVSRGVVRQIDRDSFSFVIGPCR